LTERAPEASFASWAAAAAEAARVDIRNATVDDLGACFDIWRDGLNGYMVPLNQPPIPAEVTSVSRLHRHLLTTDPELFVVACRRGDGRIVGFGAAVRRSQVWFLSMLFVAPGAQNRGVGRALLERLLPADDAVLATATDTAQPVSNALYARLGIPPRLPLFSVVGRPERGDAFAALPQGIDVVPFAQLPDDNVAATIATLDRDVLGYTHSRDHEFAVAEGRRGYLFCARGGDPVGYGYTSEVGRIGPIAVRDPALLASVVGHLASAIVPRGASAVWVPGAAGETLAALLDAGFRLEGFPVLLCWSRPFADFGRYLPISPGLL
jgi:GNAT superfamily N-acetyltransferase